jgi:stage II sporulation protein D
MRAALCVALFFAWPLAAAPVVLKVQLRTAQGPRVVEMPLEKYVAAVLAGESSVFQSPEALQAMAVAARTYAVRMKGRHSAEGFDLCDTTHCQRLDVGAATARLEHAAAETTGELLWFQGKPAFTPYTRDCGGTTEEAGNVWADLAAPYLKSHADPYCRRTPAVAWQWNADPRDILRALQQSQLRGPRVLDQIVIAERTTSGRSSVLTLAGAAESIRISASSFRFAIGRELGWNTIRGDQYEVHSSNGRIVFEGKGEGHGVGLCQRGAEQMGLAGKTYREILAFYYPGTIVGLTGQGLGWQRISGETMSLWSTHPDQDRIALATAERLARSVSQRVAWPLPAGVEIRVYPDLDTFRDATGEPGWVAAHTVGRRIDLQPLPVLQRRDALDSTLSHELLHVIVESRTVPGLPAWFREGLVGYLENSSKGAQAPGDRAPSENDLRQMDNAGKARRAYADATNRVANLVRTYSESVVLGWVKRGLPADVTKASSNQAPANSR